MSEVIVFLMIFFGPPLVLACRSVVFAARAAPYSGYDRMHRRHRAKGAATSVIGIAVMVFVAWSTREDFGHVEGEAIFSVFVAMMGGALILFGLGPLVSWLLS